MIYRDLDPKLAGIYIFKNNINGKCYVGQSVSLRKQLKHHLSNLKTGRYDLPLYRALVKYGIHNFTIDVLESFIPDPDMDQRTLIKKLDDLEIRYIEKYKAYEEGYNCTKGGDFGVLGLKMTPEQRKKVAENSRKAAVWSYKPVYLYNVLDHTTIYAISITAAAHILKTARSGITRAARGTQWLVNEHLCAHTLEDLDKRKIEFQNYLKNRICVESAYNLKLYDLQGNFIIKGGVNEISKYAGCAKTTIYSAMSRGALLLRKYRIEKELIPGTSRVINTGRPSPRKGVSMSSEQKEKIKKALHKYNVLQYDKNGNFIKKHDSVQDAAESVNTDIKSIRRVCQGTALSCKGYVWKYELRRSDRKQTA